MITFHHNLKEAIQNFQHSLQRLQKLARLSTICMHGSPMSPHDSEDLWKIAMAILILTSTRCFTSRIQGVDGMGKR